MNSDPIQNLLRTADEQSQKSVDDVGALTHRVLRTRSRRRAIRNGAVLVLLLAISILTLDLTKRSPMPEMASRNNKPVVAGRVERVQPDEFQNLHDQIALGEMIVNRLEQNEARDQRSSRLVELKAQPDERQLVERAATVLILQAERALRETSDPEPALRAYRQVVANFPQATAAEVARQRIAQIEKAG